MCTDGVGEAATVGIMGAFASTAGIGGAETGLAPLSAKTLFFGLFVLAFLGAVVVFVTSASALI